MPSVLTQSSIPLWASIVIIVFGSVLLLAVVLTVWRCRVSRRRQQERNTPRYTPSPMRRLTIRGGRTVDTSNRISLTGSQFGFDEIPDLEEQNQARGHPPRSKSPFSTWLASMRAGSPSKRNQSPAMQEKVKNGARPISYPKAGWLGVPEPAYSLPHLDKTIEISDHSIGSFNEDEDFADDEGANSPDPPTVEINFPTSNPPNFSRAQPFRLSLSRPRRRMSEPRMPKILELETPPPLPVGEDDVSDYLNIERRGSPESLHSPQKEDSPQSTQADPAPMAPRLRLTDRRHSMPLFSNPPSPMRSSTPPLSSQLSRPSFSGRLSWRQVTWAATPSTVLDHIPDDHHNSLVLEPSLEIGAYRTSFSEDHQAVPEPPSSRKGNKLRKKSIPRRASDF